MTPKATYTIWAIGLSLLYMLALAFWYFNWRSAGDLGTGLDDWLQICHPLSMIVRYFGPFAALIALLLALKHGAHKALILPFVVVAVMGCYYAADVLPKVVS